MQLIEQALVSARDQYAARLGQGWDSTSYWRDAVKLFTRIVEGGWPYNESDLKFAREVLEYSA